MSETYEVFDPFIGRNVSISNKLIDRLRGKYAVGPTMENGEPELGYRQHEIVPIQAEAADEIKRLRAENKRLLGRIGSMCGYPLCDCDQKNKDPSFCLVTDGDVPDPITRETLVADARRNALEEALVACQTEADAHRALPAPKEYEERYLGAAIGCDGCTSTIHALIAAETRRENSTKRDIPAELTSVKAAIDRQPESTKANLAGKFKMGNGS